MHTFHLVSMLLKSLLVYNKAFCLLKMFIFDEEMKSFIV